MSGKFAASARSRVSGLQHGDPTGGSGLGAVPGERPSKTALKARSTELQNLGEQLLTLPAAARADLDLPTTLMDALEKLESIRAFEGARRQRQWVGKLMRGLAPEQVTAIRTALDAERSGAAGATLRLHTAERWRARLLADDEAITDWMQLHPRCNAQRLRQLVRQARAAVGGGGPPQSGELRNTTTRNAARQLFRLLDEVLAEEATGRTPDNDRN